MAFTRPHSRFSRISQFPPPFRPVWASDSPRCRFLRLQDHFGIYAADFPPASIRHRPLWPLFKFAAILCPIPNSPLTARLPTCKAHQKPSRFRIGNERATAFDPRELKHHFMGLTPLCSAQHFADELEHEVALAEDEWRQIDRKLMKWFGTEAAASLALAPQIGLANVSWLAASLAVAGVANLAESRSERRSLPHKMPGAFFLGCKHK